MSLPVRYRKIDSAASMPAATAPMATPGPVCTSPPANTPARSVDRVTGSTSVVFHRVIFTSARSSITEMSGCWPMAQMS